MKLGCTIKGHRAGPAAVYNSGYYFSDCARCGRPLIRTARSGWQPIPAGHRLVWKEGRHSHSLEADYAGVLPVVHDRPQLPALRSPFTSWSRALVRLRTSAASAAQPSATAAIEEESGDYRCSRLLLAAVIVGAGFKVLLDLAAGR